MSQLALIALITEPMFLLFLLGVRAFSETARATNTNVEFGCLLVGHPILMGLLVLAVDHLSFR